MNIYKLKNTDGSVYWSAYKPLDDEESIVEARVLDDQLLYLLTDDDKNWLLKEMAHLIVGKVGGKDEA